MTARRPRPKPNAWVKRSRTPDRVDVTVGNREYRGLTEHEAQELADREGWKLRWVPSL